MFAEVALVPSSVKRDNDVQLQAPDTKGAQHAYRAKPPPNHTLPKMCMNPSQLLFPALKSLGIHLPPTSSFLSCSKNRRSISSKACGLI
jgi:hypothetical protein